MHSTKWGHRAPHVAGPRTGLRAQLSRGAHLTWTSLRVLALNPRLMILPFFALVFTGFTWLFVVLSFLVRDLWGLHQEGVLGTRMELLLLFSFGLAPLIWRIVGCAATLGWAVGAILYWLVLSALWSDVHGILVVTLYHYATHSEAAFGFNWQALNHPWIR